MEMASDNQITIVGNLTDDPELRYTPNGAAVVNFPVAVTPRIRDEGGGWKDGDTSFFRVRAWRTLAEISRAPRVTAAAAFSARRRHASTRTHALPPSFQPPPPSRIRGSASPDNVTAAAPRRVYPRP